MGLGQAHYPGQFPPDDTADAQCAKHDRDEEREAAGAHPFRQGDLS